MSNETGEWPMEIRVWHAMHGDRDAVEGEETCEVCGKVKCEMCQVETVCSTCYQHEQEEREWRYQREVEYNAWLAEREHRRLAEQRLKWSEPFGGLQF